MDRKTEITILITSMLSSSDDVLYVEKLLNEFSELSEGMGFHKMSNLVSFVANKTFNGHEKEYPSNVLDYITLVRFGHEVNRDKWKPHKTQHEMILEFIKSGMIKMSFDENSVKN